MQCSTAPAVTICIKVVIDICLNSNCFYSQPQHIIHWLFHLCQTCPFWLYSSVYSNIYLNFFKKIKTFQIAVQFLIVSPMFNQKECHPQALKTNCTLYIRLVMVSISWPQFWHGWNFCHLPPHMAQVILQFFLLQSDESTFFHPDLPLNVAN